MKRLLFLLTGVILVILACTKNYVNPPSPGRMIKQFKLEAGQYGTETINAQNGIYNVNVLVAKGVELNALIPQITVSEGATVSPKSGEKIDISGNKALNYTVTAADGQVRVWTVNFKVVDSSIEDYGTYIITSALNNQYLGITGDTLYNKKYNNNAKLEVSGLGSNNGIAKFQKWHTIYKTTENGVKYYQIRNLFSGKLLNVPNSSSAPGLQLEQNQVIKDKINDQLWRIDETIEPGVYQIINKGNGMALTSENLISGINKALQQVADASSSAQKWKLTPALADSYRDDDVVNFFNRNLPSQGSVAFDQGNSIPLSWGANNGKVLWVTQDAWDGVMLRANSMFQCGTFFNYGNSMILQPSKTDWNSEHTPNITIPGGANGRARQICTIQPNNSFAWPGAGVEIGNKVYIHCGEGNGLSATNQSLYILTESDGLQWSAQRTTPAGLSGQTSILYSTGMVKANDGYVYTFGTSSPPGSFGYSSDIHVARFLQSAPQNWTFWNGNAWINSPIMGSSSRISTGLGSSAISYLNGKYILMTMDQGFNCGDNKRDIYISTSTSPTGPFTERKKVYTVTEYFYGQNARYYTPAIHPTFDNGKNELLITYCLNFSSCGLGECQEGVIDPYYYRVKGVRVPYSMIGL